MSDLTPRKVREPIWISVCALVLSLAAVLVSLAVAIVPGIAADQSRSASALRFLDLLTSSKVNAPIAAQSYTVANSDADRFAAVVQTYWFAVDLGSTKRKDVA